MCSSRSDAYKGIPMTTNSSAGISPFRHYYHRDSMGNIHVETVINGVRWQHHVYSADAGWSELMAEGELIGLPDHECACDLLAGQVLEHDGRIWNHPHFISSRRGLMWEFLSFFSSEDCEPVPRS